MGSVMAQGMMVTGCVGVMLVYTNDMKAMR